jgi:hypothetical protein
MRILKDRSAALIIDIQEKLYPFIFENEKLTKNVTKLLEGLKILGVPIFITEQYVKGLGPENHLNHSFFAPPLILFSPGYIRQRIGIWSLPPGFPVKTPVLDRFGQMLGTDIGLVVDIRNGSRDLEDAVEGPGG